MFSGGRKFGRVRLSREYFHQIGPLFPVIWSFAIISRRYFAGHDERSIYIYESVYSFSRLFLKRKQFKLLLCNKKVEDKVIIRLLIIYYYSLITIILFCDIDANISVLFIRKFSTSMLNIFSTGTSLIGISLKPDTKNHSKLTKN